MQELLSEENSHLFSEEYPIFYKNKLDKGKEGEHKYYYLNAIDTAIEND